MITCYVPKPDFTQHDKEMNLGWFPCDSHSVANIAPWILVKDKLPEFDESGYTNDVLFFSRKYGYTCGFAKNDNGLIRWMDGLHSYGDDIVAWMPIPELPEGIL